MHKLARLRKLERFLRPRDLDSTGSGYCSSAGGWVYPRHYRRGLNHDAHEGNYLMCKTRRPKRLDVPLQPTFWPFTDCSTTSWGETGDVVITSGQGLAKGDGPTRLWRALSNEYSSATNGSRNLAVLRGFLNGLSAAGNTAAQEFLDDAMSDPALLADFPSLQVAAGIDKRGIERLRACVDRNLVPASSFWALTSGREKRI